MSRQYLEHYGFVGDDYLEHYGVKGMKWRNRKRSLRDRRMEQFNRTAESTEAEERKYKDQNYKRALDYANMLWRNEHIGRTRGDADRAERYSRQGRNNQDYFHGANYGPTHHESANMYYRHNRDKIDSANANNAHNFFEKVREENVKKRKKKPAGSSRGDADRAARYSRSRFRGNFGR